MTTAAFDMLTIARRLQSAGFSEDQAEAVTGVLRDSRDNDLSLLSTKADIANIRIELRTEIAETKYEILKWVLSAIGFQTIVVVGPIVALAKGLH